MLELTGKAREIRACGPRVSQLFLGLEES